MSPPAGARTPEPVRRTAEIEEITNLYFIHPVASRLVPLAARMGVTANALTLAGLLLGVLAGFAYYRYQDLRFAVAGFVLMIGWHIMDGADGQLARLTHSQSHFGKVLDGISDTATFLAVYAALALALGRKYGDRAYALVIVAAMFHAVQSATYEARRQEYELWGWGRKSEQPPQTAAAAHGGSRAGTRGAHGSPVERLFGFLHRLFYLWLSFPAADITEKIHASMAAALDRQPESAAFVRERYRQVFAPLVRRWSLLSANYRTLGIFVCVLLAVPEDYFWFEIVGFSALLALLIASEYACYRRLLVELDAANVALP